MRVFVAGATGVIGRQPLPLLTSHGHEVIGWPTPTAPRSRSWLSPAAGGWGVAFMTQLRGADNTLARSIFDWAPRYSSWRQGSPQS